MTDSQKEIFDELLVALQAVSDEFKKMASIAEDIRPQI